MTEYTFCIIQNTKIYKIQRILNNTKKYKQKYTTQKNTNKNTKQIRRIQQYKNTKNTITNTQKY